MTTKEKAMNSVYGVQNGTHTQTPKSQNKYDNINVL